MTETRITEPIGARALMLHTRVGHKMGHISCESIITGHRSTGGRRRPCANTARMSEVGQDAAASDEDAEDDRWATLLESTRPESASLAMTAVLGPSAPSGSQPFPASSTDGRRWFVKVLNNPQGGQILVTGEYIEASSLTFEDYAREWLDTYTGRTS